MTNQDIVTIALISSLSFLMAFISLVFAHYCRGRKLIFLLVSVHYLFVLLAFGSALGGLITATLNGMDAGGPAIGLGVLTIVEIGLGTTGVSEALRHT